MRRALTNLLGALAMAVLLLAAPHLDTATAWARAQQAQVQAWRAEQAWRLGMVEYMRWVQARCGPETWWLPTQDGALECVTRRGRRTGQLLMEANP